MGRRDALQSFLDAASVAFDQCVQDLHARRSIAQIYARLDAPAEAHADRGRRLPVCSQYLDEALLVRTGRPALDALIDRFVALEPGLEWACRPTYDDTASDNFLMAHANTMIVGPGGLEDRRDVWLGASLMAPNTRYPDHDHAPEETYLVLSDGEFLHGDSGWFSPGVGGSFYNPPGIRHAMRSGGTPLFALWALLPDQPGNG